ncbi:hypothetical protein U8V72_17530 [Priestia filamentosa]|uniref:hypothetical protein n=1 Tax=Priestia filamentosa TaxID=1402861 RepID=UPI000B085E9E
MGILYKIAMHTKGEVNPENSKELKRIVKATSTKSRKKLFKSPAYAYSDSKK